MESKQTSIEWLAEELELYGNPGYCEIEWKQLDSLIQQAKEMHKQEIEDAFNEGQALNVRGKLIHGKQYYSETYNK